MVFRPRNPCAIPRFVALVVVNPMDMVAGWLIAKIGKESLKIRIKIFDPSAAVPLESRIVWVVASLMNVAPSLVGFRSAVLDGPGLSAAAGLGCPAPKMSPKRDALLAAVALA